MSIYTCSWSALQRQRNYLACLPVRISVGLPRFWPEAREFPYVMELAPVGLLDLTADEFDAAYVARLEKGGVDRIVTRLREVEATTDLDVVLMCFERDRTQCHRSLAATWYSQQTGEVPWEEYDPWSTTYQLDLGQAFR